VDQQPYRRERGPPEKFTLTVDSKNNIGESDKRHNVADGGRPRR